MEVTPMHFPIGDREVESILIKEGLDGRESRSARSRDLRPKADQERDAAQGRARSGQGARDVRSGVHYAHEVLKELGLDETPVDKLHEIPAVALEEAARKLPFGKLGPVVDGRTLVDQPWDPDAPAISAHVPVIVIFGDTDSHITNDPDRETWLFLPALPRSDRFV
jgi:hypothetical protein